MKLLVLSHKETWPTPASPTGYSTTGGFPFQMQVISELFDQTLLLLPSRAAPPPPGLRPLTGHNLSVQTLPEPAGSDLRRKLALLTWLPRYLPVIWRVVQEADAVHAPVPGDIGLIGIVLALAQRKPLFVRHCGTWGKPKSIADRFLFWLLERVAGGKNVVLASGWSENPPSKRNPNIAWIFSTTLSEAELLVLPTSRAGDPLSAPQLVTVGRLSAEKNIQAIIQAVPAIQARFPGVVLHIVGDGVYRSVLEKLTLELGVQERVIFHGNVSHEAVLQILSRCHLFVFPSLREGFPKALLEAIACGLPVVASDVSATPFLIRDCGKVFDIPDGEHITAAVLELLGNPSNLATLREIAHLKARGYTLEAWQVQIANHLRAAWGLDLNEPA